MHQLVLLTAMTAASGLFGGGRQCTTGRCPNATVRGPIIGMRHHNMAQPAYQVYTPSAQAPAPTAQAPVYYQSNYSAPVVSSCPNGTCPRR